MRPIEKQPSQVTLPTSGHSSATNKSVPTDTLQIFSRAGKALRSGLGSAGLLFGGFYVAAAAAEFAHAQPKSHSHGDYNFALPEPLVAGIIAGPTALVVAPVASAMLGNKSPARKAFAGLAAAGIVGAGLGFAWRS